MAECCYSTARPFWIGGGGQGRGGQGRGGACHGAAPIESLPLHPANVIDTC